MSKETELIKERLNLADVIGEYVQLKQAGNHFKGLCPFHQEKTPSFVVSPDRGIWHCFGCSEGGDVFSFVQKVEGLDFPGTLKMLAERAGVQLSARRADDTGSNGRARLFEVLALTAKVYHDILLRQKTGEKARAYLQERGVLPATLDTFEVGYAPMAWHTVRDFLQRKGFTEREMIDAGLVVRNQQGKVYDRFRGRIMFPIYDVQGRVVAFGGRIVPWHATGEEGKYVNSPETSIYEKRRVVYNLHRARQAIRQQQHALVVEGYMDVVMLVQCGVANVVASSGTAFTAEHITLLQRFTPTLHFAFDGDAAGLKAAISATHGAIGAGMRVATIFFNDGKDPADIAAADPAMLQQVLSQPQSLVQVLLRQLQSSGTGASREALLRDVLPFVKQVRHPVQQGELVQELATTLHVPESVVIEQLARVPLPASAPRSAVSDSATPLGFTAEQRLVGLLVLEPSLAATLLPQLSARYFQESQSQVLFGSISALAATHTDFIGWTPDQVLVQLEEPLQPFAEAARQLCAASRATSSDTALHEGEQLVRYLKRRHLEEALIALQRQLALQPASAGALQQFQKLAEELAHVKAEV